MCLYKHEVGDGTVVEAWQLRARNARKPGSLPSCSPILLSFGTTRAAQLAKFPRETDASCPKVEALAGYLRSKDLLPRLNTLAVLDLLM